MSSNVAYFALGEDCRFVGKDEIIYEELGERLVILKLLVLLFNLRANKVGISQIKNMYMPLFKKNPLNVLNDD